MQIIGASFGRTGTTSMRIALNHLGFGPCYHMFEVFLHPSHIAQWQAAADGETVDWRKFLADYPSGIDYPLSAFYKEILEAFPEAKVILNLRDPESWWQSTRETIYGQILIPDWMNSLFFFHRHLKKMIEDAVWNRLFHGRFLDKDYAIQVFNDHVEEVKGSISSDKLLIFNVKEGWQPLCEFLDVPVPDRPFPHANHRSLIRFGFVAVRIFGILIVASLIALITYLLLSLR